MIAENQKRAVITVLGLDGHRQVLNTYPSFSRRTAKSITPDR